MDRRTAIRNLALVIGGTALLPSCLSDHHGKASIALKKIDVSADQEQFLADLCETIIPKTDTPGAKDLRLHLFVLKMVDDCFSKNDQDAFMSGMDKVAQDAKDRYGKPFGHCTQSQREALLTALDKKQATLNDQKKNPQQADTPADDTLTFYGITKGETIFGYTYSKFFMTKEIIWELVPGRYDAYYPVKKFKAALKYG